MRTHVLMGVCGSGKSLIGAMLARELGVEFVEGDEMHPPENVRRMAAGIPLTDDDRREWLLAIAARLRDAKRAGVGLVVSCSALKRRYRDVLRVHGDADVCFIYLAGTKALIAERMAMRRGHFMPASLLESQFDALEEPSLDEHALACDVSAPPESIVADLVARTASA